MIRCAFFDLDGTLVDSIPGLHAGASKLARAHGLEELSIEELSVLVGKGVRCLTARMLEVWKRKGCSVEGLDSDSLADELVEIWSSPEFRSRLFPGVKESLASLKDHGVKCVLVTNKDSKLARELVEEIGIAPLFAHVLAAGDVERLKPAPDLVELAMEKCGCSSDEAVMVGDSANDALAARAAGVAVILVRGGYNEGESIDAWARENGFDTVVDSACEAVVEILSGYPH